MTFFFPKYYSKQDLLKIDNDLSVHVSVLVCFISFNLIITKIVFIKKVLRSGKLVN